MQSPNTSIPMAVNREDEMRAPRPEGASFEYPYYKVETQGPLPLDDTTMPKTLDAITTSLIDRHSPPSRRPTLSIASSIYGSEIPVSLAPTIVSTTAAPRPASQGPPFTLSQHTFTPTLAYRQALLRSYKRRFCLCACGLQAGVVSLLLALFYVIYARRLGYAVKMFAVWLGVSLGVVLWMRAVAWGFWRRIREMKGREKEGEGWRGEFWFLRRLG